MNYSQKHIVYFFYFSFNDIRVIEKSGGNHIFYPEICELQRNRKFFSLPIPTQRLCLRPSHPPSTSPEPPARCAWCCWGCNSGFQQPRWDCQPAGSLDKGGFLFFLRTALHSITWASNQVRGCLPSRGRLKGPRGCHMPWHPSSPGVCVEEPQRRGWVGLLLPALTSRGNLSLYKLPQFSEVSKQASECLLPPCPSSPLRRFNLISLFSGANLGALPPRVPTCTDRWAEATQGGDMHGVSVTSYSPHCPGSDSISGCEDGQARDTPHWTDEINSSFSVTHTRSLRAEDTATHTGPRGGASGQSKQAGWGGCGAGFVASRRM